MSTEKKKQRDRENFRKKIKSMTPEQYQLYLERRRIHYMKSKLHITDKIYKNLLSLNKERMDKLPKWKWGIYEDSDDAKKLMFSIKNMIENPVKQKSFIERLVEWMKSFLR